MNLRVLRCRPIGYSDIFRTTGPIALEEQEEEKDRHQYQSSGPYSICQNYQMVSSDRGIDIVADMTGTFLSLLVYNLGVFGCY